MKRGLICWDKNELAPAVLEQRIDSLREILIEQDLSAIVIYSELWRSNQARFYSNYMPYFNRALLVLPQLGKPTLLCGLSPRVYKWIQSVTVIEDIRPAKNFTKAFGQLITEKNWQRLGILDANQMPYDLYQNVHSCECELINIDSSNILVPSADKTELLMRKEAINLTNTVLSEQMPNGVGKLDYNFIGSLEGALRGQGAEDLIILISNGDKSPALANGETLQESFSVSVALEYRGHWIRLSRVQTSPEIKKSIKNKFDLLLSNPRDIDNQDLILENLGASYPYEPISYDQLKPGCLFAMHITFENSGKQFYYGDTCLYSEQGAHIL